MKTLLWDIEICHNYNEDYQRRMYCGWIDTGVRMSADISCITHIGYKWLGEKQTYCKDLTDFPGFGPNAKNEEALVKFASELFQQADHLVGHYADKFDRRYLNAKLLQYGLPPLPPSPALKQSDTCKLARSHIKLSSNKLDNVARFLKVPMKRKKNWPGDWLLMTKGDCEAFKRVKYYCIGDVITLEKVYQKLLMFSNSPNLAIRDREDKCIKCGGSKYINYGSHYTKEKVYQRYRCKDCSTVFHAGQFVQE